MSTLINCILIFVPVLALNSYQGLEKQIKMENIYINVGDTVELRCRNTSEALEIIWRNENTILYEKMEINTKYQRHNHLEVPYDQILKIKDAQKADLGKYRCEWTDKQRLYQKIFNLQLIRVSLSCKEIISNLTIWNTDSEDMVHCIEGKECQLTCSLDNGLPRATLMWLNSVDVSYTSQLNLIINPNASHHMTNYTCRADQLVEKQHKILESVISLNVSFLKNVKIEAFPGSSVDEGLDVKLHCSGKGNPQGIVTWTKNGVVLPNYSKILYINNLTRNDSAAYVCNMTNIAGSKSDMINLTIFYQPDVTVVNFYNGTLLCNASGLPDKYTYSKWEHQSVYGEHIRYLDGTDDGYLHLTKHDGWGIYNSGQYLCSARNSVHISTKLYQMGVEKVVFEGKPECINSPSVYSFTGDRVFLSVDFYSSPAYTELYWLNTDTKLYNLNNTIQTNSTKVIKVVIYDKAVHLDGYNANLTILEVGQKYSSNYTLVISNANGKGHCIVNLVILSEVKAKDEQLLTPTQLYIIACGCTVLLVFLVMGIHNRCARNKEAQQKKSNSNKDWILPPAKETGLSRNCKQTRGVVYEEVVLNPTSIGKKFVILAKTDGLLS